MSVNFNLSIFESLFIKSRAATIILSNCCVIGEGAIIAAGAVVTKNVELFTIVAGNPAKRVRRIEKS